MIKLPVVKISDVSDTCPAFVSFESGTIYVNSPYFSKLSKEIQSFILHHEQGHYVLNTDNDFLADRYAFDQVAGKISTLSIFDAISLLDTSKDLAAKRFTQIYLMILKYKYQQTGEIRYMNEIDSFLNSTKNMSNNLTLTQGGISYFLPDNNQSPGPFLMGNIQYSESNENEYLNNTPEVSAETENIAFPYLQKEVIEPVARFIDEAREEIKEKIEPVFFKRNDQHSQSFVTEKVLNDSPETIIETSETWIEKHFWFVLVIIVLLLIIIRK